MRVFKSRANTKQAGLGDKFGIFGWEIRGEYVIDLVDDWDVNNKLINPDIYVFE